MSQDFSDIFVVVGGADDLSDGTQAHVLAHLNGTVRNRTSGVVHLAIDGFDDDPRELWQVPEVRAYIRGLVLGLHTEVLARLDDHSKVLAAICCDQLRPVGRDPVTGNTRFERVLDTQDGP
jgi:hypothetical protein